MSKLPQHIQSKIKEFVESCEDWVDDGHGDEFAVCTVDEDKLSELIATILEEEKVRILQERDMTISMFYRNWKRRPPADKTDFDDVIAKLSI